MTNPIGEKYSAVAAEFLEGRVGQEVSMELIEQLQALMVATECEFVGVPEAGEMLGVSPQRIRQLNMPPEAGRLSGGPTKPRRFWLRADMAEFRNERSERRDKFMFSAPVRRQID